MTKDKGLKKQTKAPEVTFCFKYGHFTELLVITLEDERRQEGLKKHIIFSYKIFPKYQDWVRCPILTTTAPSAYSQSIFTSHK